MTELGGNETLPVAEAGRIVEEMRRHITHLEHRLASQKRALAYRHDANRLENVKRQRWHNGRETLLREMLRDATGSMYGWKAEADKLRRELASAQAALPPPKGSPS